MPRLFIPGLVLILLLGAGYGLTTTQAARAIPWDCSDWQAFAHADRTIVILESLAENRGKTLYCGVDQSDTFTKAETWAAGKDRNERDDTIYSGERGIFRGFIAAQEGWLTDGESGITGVSIDRIFEFPREKKKRRTRIKRLAIPADPSRTARSPNGPTVNVGGTRSFAEERAQFSFNNNRPSFDWEQRAAAAALAECRSRGYPRARNVASVPSTEGWGYTPDRQPQNPLGWTFEAYKTRQWTATCEKKVRRRR